MAAAARAPGYPATRGLPVEFSNYLSDGRRVAHGVPLQGQFSRQ